MRVCMKVCAESEAYRESERERLRVATGCIKTELTSRVQLGRGRRLRDVREGASP